MPNPFEQLGLTIEATVEEVRARYLELSKVHHPDHGGQAEAFAQLKATYDQALAIAMAPKPCAPCKGKGRVKVKNGFTVIEMMCSECKGSGKRQLIIG